MQMLLGVLMLLLVLLLGAAGVLVATVAAVVVLPIALALMPFLMLLARLLLKKGERPVPAGLAGGARRTKSAETNRRPLVPVH